jgi:cytochrome c553
MRHIAAPLVAVFVGLGAAAAVGQDRVSLAWAYGFATPGPEPVAPPCPADSKPYDCSKPGRVWGNDPTPLRLPGSDRTFTIAQIQSHYDPADWLPGEHPPVPDIVQHGKEQERMRACAHCHFHNGLGKPENGHVAGLPVSYFTQQIALFKGGGRRSADPRKANANEMIQIARLLSDEEIRAAAEYYGSMKWKPWVNVIESAVAPKTRVSAAGLFIPLDDGMTEPLGERVIEVPEFPDRTERLRDPKAGFVAYVPVGSVEKGKALVTTGAGKTTQCTTCHGTDLQGLGDTPGIADRTMSYTVRQLNNIQQGTRQSPIMKPVVAQLTADDMIAIAAYLASL